MLRKLAGQTAVYGISSIGARFLNYLLTPYLTRVLTTSQYGVINDLYALIPLLLVVLTLGLETGFFRFHGRAETDAEKRNIFQTGWGAILIACSLFFVFVVLFNRPLATVMEYRDFPSYIWLTGLIVTFDVAATMPFAKLRAEGRAKRFVTIRMVSVVVNVLACVFFYSVLPRIDSLSFLWNANYGAGYVLIANVIQSTLVLAMLWPSLRGYQPALDKNLFRRLFFYSLPLLISGTAGMANEFLDRQFIKYLMPENLALSSLGIYGAVTKIAVVMTLFVQMYRFAAEPFFLSNFKKEDFTRTNAEAMKYFVIVSVFIFLVITLYSDLFALIIGRDFREGISILPVVLLGNIFSGMVLNLSFWYKHSGQTRYALWITGTGLAFTIGLNILLIPRVGYLGAAWARFVCEFVMVTMSYYLCRKHYPIPYDLGRIGSYFITGAVLYAIGLNILSLLPKFPAMALNLLIIGGFVIFVVRLEKLDLRAILRSVTKTKR